MTPELEKEIRALIRVVYTEIYNEACEKFSGGKPEPKSEPKSNPCGDCIHTEIRTSGFPCSGCLGTANHPNFKPKWEPQSGEYVYSLAEYKPVIFKDGDATSFVRPLTLADVTKESAGVKVTAHEDVSGNLWIAYDSPSFVADALYEKNDIRTRAQRCFLTLAGVPILSFKAWEQITKEE